MHANRQLRLFLQSPLPPTEIFFYLERFSTNEFVKPRKLVSSFEIIEINLYLKIEKKHTVCRSNLSETK